MIHRKVILSVVLYGCETWSRSLREEPRPRVCENAAVKRMFVPKREEVTGECRELHDEDLIDLYPSSNTF